MFRLGLSLALIFLLLSCGRKVKKHEGAALKSNIAVTKDNLNSFVQDDYLYDTVIFIPVFVPNSILMGQIVEIKKYKDFYYTLDKSHQSIYKFDSDWQFQGVLNRQGPGPEEYNEIFNFNFYNNSLVINDLWEVNHYDLVDFSFISSYPKNFPGFKTYVTNDGHVINHQLNSPFDDTQYNITIYNYLNNKITQQSHSIPPYMKDFTFSQKSHFFSNGMDEFFILPFNDTIFEVNEGKFMAHRIINFEDNPLELAEFRNKKISASEIVNSGDAYFIGDYATNPSFELFTFSLEGRRYKYHLTKKDNIGLGYSSLKQVQTPLMIPLNYHLLEDSSLISFKSMDEVAYEMEVLKERENALPKGMKTQIQTLETMFDDADGVVVMMILKNAQPAD